jgi:hypothetical protein
MLISEPPFVRWKSGLQNRLSGSDRDAFDDIAGDLAASAIVEAGGANVGVAGEELHVLDGDVLLEQGRDGGDTGRKQGRS